MENQTKALRTVEPQQVITADDVRKVFCPLATDAEIAMFLGVCKSHSLDPWRREAYLIKYSSSQAATIVVGKDTFTRRAQQNPKFRGFKAGVIVSRPAGDKGFALAEIEGSFTMPTDKIVGGWAEVYLDNYAVQLKASVSMAEYSTGKSGWVKMPATMIRKVALVQALREAFPDELGGLYDQAEMGVDVDSAPRPAAPRVEAQVVVPKVMSVSEVQESKVTPQQDAQAVPAQAVVAAPIVVSDKLPTEESPSFNAPEKEPKDKTMDRCMTAFKKLNIGIVSSQAIVAAHDRDWELLLHNLNELKSALKGKSKEDAALEIGTWILRMTGGAK